MLLLKLRPFKDTYFHMLIFLLNKPQFLAEGCWFGIRETAAIISLHHSSIQLPLTVLQKLHTVFMKHLKRSQFNLVTWIYLKN